MKIVEFKDYDNQTTPLSAYNLNRLQQNLITTKYQMTFSSAVSGGSTITLPCYYQVGQDTLDVYLNSELLKKASTKDSEGHYYEVGNSDTKSNQIKITSDWSIASGDVLNLIVRGTTDSYDQNLSPDKATQLADEISANKEEITALQTENSRLKGITNALPKISGEDTSLTLTNTANAPLSDIILKGNTSQQQYSGKNLLNVISNDNNTNNGITFSIEKNGFQLKLNGTSQNNTGIAIGLNKIQLPQTGTYYFVAQIISGSVTNNLGLGINFGKDNIIDLSNSTKSGKVSFSAAKTEGYLTIFVNANISFNNLIINFQVISTDTLDLDFEPYVGGIVSPNPDYPQDINVVSGDKTIKISNKNLLPLDRAISTTINGVIIKRNDDQSITFKGKATETIWYNLINNINLTLNGNYTYIAICNGTVNPAQLGGFQLLLNQPPISFINDDRLNPNGLNYRNMNITTSQILKNLNFVLVKDSVIDMTIKIMLLQGTYNTSNMAYYEPYKQQVFPISLGSLELCKIGDYQDYFYKSGSIWYLHKEINKITSYNGETITTSYISTTGELSTGAKVYYVVTPTDTEITDTTLISQLNALYNAYTYNDTTNISQTNANLPFIINAEAFKKIS